MAIAACTPEIRLPLDAGQLDWFLIEDDATLRLAVFGIEILLVDHLEFTLQLLHLLIGVVENLFRIQTLW